MVTFCQERVTSRAPSRNAHSGSGGPFSVRSSLWFSFGMSCQAILILWPKMAYYETAHHGMGVVAYGWMLKPFLPNGKASRFVSPPASSWQHVSDVWRFGKQSIQIASHHPFSPPARLRDCDRFPIRTSRNSSEEEKSQINSSPRRYRPIFAQTGSHEIIISWLVNFPVSGLGVPYPRLRCTCQSIRIIRFGFYRGKWWKKPYTIRNTHIHIGVFS